MRRILLARRYRGAPVQKPAAVGDRFSIELGETPPDARQLLAGYCAALYRRYGSYEDVSRITGLDRRTVKKHLLNSRSR